MKSRSQTLVSDTKGHLQAVFVIISCGFASIHLAFPLFFLLNPAR